jgi:hypothetical protein
MGIYSSQAGKDIEKATGSKRLEQVLRRNTVVKMSPADEAAYKKYKTGVKKLGGKQVATPAEFKEIRKRMARTIVNKSKSKYAEYARQTGQPDLSSAGSDEEMLRKKFFKKKISNLPTKAEINEYNRLGGSKTKEGRAYRRKWMEK